MKFLLKKIDLKLVFFLFGFCICENLAAQNIHGKDFLVWKLGRHLSYDDFKGSKKDFRLFLNYKAEEFLFIRDSLDKNQEQMEGDTDRGSRRDTGNLNFSIPKIETSSFEKVDSIDCPCDTTNSSSYFVNAVSFVDLNTSVILLDSNLKFEIFFLFSFQFMKSNLINIY